MKAIISKWGNSPALRLPSAVMKDAEFSLQQQVNITVTRGRIVIEPAETLEFNLEKLVAGISPENTHEEIVFGGPVGKEAL